MIAYSVQVTLAHDVGLGVQVVVVVVVSDIKSRRHTCSLTPSHQRQTLLYCTVIIVAGVACHIVMASFVEVRTGMTWLTVALVLAAVVSLARGDAGHFFAETPKHLPRIGRRGDLPPLATLLSEEEDASWRGMTEALAGLDSDGDGCVGVAELLRIPVVRMALLLQNPALLVPQQQQQQLNPSQHQETTRSDSFSDHRPEPHLLRFLQK
ncbi:hypothetical protein Pcinc_038759 [Petrolisthes cinctipes]|uniref:EF-hand domain-containing protein n=1 Tax=Petrolisthes cinctipes TaxID=88211 RepID=A0AAE1BST4_PETCI|nr:hypothetical protein Pcinc_038759 [Petrolisthes cinctipes]